MRDDHHPPDPSRIAADDLVATPRATLGTRAQRGLRLVADVAEGDAVEVGGLVAHDRLRPRIRLVAPVPGRVERIDRGLGRRLEGLVIALRLDAPLVRLSPKPGSVPDTLLARGFWPCFASRPYGSVADPEARPDAIFVDALGGPDGPGAIAAKARPLDLARGFEVLGELTSGPVVLCQQGEALAVPSARRTTVDTGPGDTLGHRIARLRSVSREGTVWTVPVQAVLAIGRLFDAAETDFTRLVRLDGTARPIHTHPGADRQDLTRPRTGPMGHVPWFETRDAHAPARPRARSLRPIVAVPALEAALPAAIRAVPLLRALSIGDDEAARRLGCLDLLEEDMAEASALCASGADYGWLLRQALDRLEADR